MKVQRLIRIFVVVLSFLFLFFIHRRGRNGGVSGREPSCAMGWSWRCAGGSTPSWSAALSPAVWGDMALHQHWV